MQVLTFKMQKFYQPPKCNFSISSYSKPVYPEGIQKGEESFVKVVCICNSWTKIYETLVEMKKLSKRSKIISSLKSRN